MKISLVCASHNGMNKLPNLIKSISKLKFKPNEIIICATKRIDVSKISFSSYKKLNIKVIISKVANQVIQRKLAIDKSKYEIITQVDDDIQLQGEPFFLIKKYLNNNSKSIIGFNILDNINNESLYKNWNDLFKKKEGFYYKFICLMHDKNKKNMTLLKSSRISPRIEFKGMNSVQNLEFLNSCMSYKKSFLKDFFDNSKYISNKAFVYEDIITTYDLYLKGYNLIIDRRIKATHPIIRKGINFKQYLNRLKYINLFRKKFKFSYFFFIIDFILITPIYYMLSTYDKKKR